MELAACHPARVDLRSPDSAFSAALDISDA
jgi:hypothetical protein